MRDSTHFCSQQRDGRALIMPRNPTNLHGINVLVFRFAESPNAYEALSNAKKPRVYVTHETNIVVFLKLIPSGYVIGKHEWDWESGPAWSVSHKPGHVTTPHASIPVSKERAGSDNLNTLPRAWGGYMSQLKQ
jgi:hypothetical protein